MASEMLAPGVSARDTADCDTPASLATSNEVTLTARAFLNAPLRP